MYKIVGADQKEYGPVTAEQLRQWIREGRANGETIARLGDGPWKPLATFPEFASLFPSTLSPTTATPPPLPLGRPISSAPPVTSGTAIGGLVCSILGLFCCGPLFSTAGLVLSVLALSQINQNPSRYSGKGVALAGIAIAILGYAVFAVLLLSGALRRAFHRFPRYF